MVDNRTNQSQINLKLAVKGVDVLIESTQAFEEELDRLSVIEKAEVIQTINERVGQVTIQNVEAHCNMYQLSLPPLPEGYESSLYVLRVRQTIRVILAIDEDPIFDRVIWTLFRVVDSSQEDAAYREIAESLYRELNHSHTAIVAV